MRIPILAVLAAPFVLALVPTVHASTITYGFDVTASDAKTGGVVLSSYKITFDPTRSYTDATVGVSTTALETFYDATTYEAGFAATPAFDYDPKYSNSLIIGGLLNGANLLTPSTNDFILAIDNLLGVPTLAVLVVSSTANRIDSDIYKGSILETEHLTSATTPEPSSLILLGTGLLGMLSVCAQKNGRLTPQRRSRLAADHAGSDIH